MLILDAEIEGRPGRGVRCRQGRIAQIASDLRPEAGEPVIDARGGALIPGLHDHHIHLLALAASLDSVHCGPPAIENVESLRAALRAASPQQGWIRGVGYHESVAGDLDRQSLDALREDVPIRIQHRSGSMWFLNSRAVAALELDSTSAHSMTGPDGMQSVQHGRARGRLFRDDSWMRERLPARAAPDLGRVGRLLASKGVTGVTDATPSNGPDEVAFLLEAQRRGDLPQRLYVMGRAALAALSVDSTGLRPGSFEIGPQKIMLDEPALPEIDETSAAIRGAHSDGRNVAIHTVTRTEIYFALAAIEAAGALGGDRLEHASIAPPDAIAQARRLGITIVTQPNFVWERGDAYRRDVEPRDQPFLYRLQAWLDEEVPVAAGTDAPFGEPDPWLAMRAAVQRRTRSGKSLGAAESVSPETALAFFTSDPRQPGLRQRPIAVGEPADLCLLDLPWAAAREELSSEIVQETICGGEPV